MAMEHSNNICLTVMVCVVAVCMTTCTVSSQQAGRKAAVPCAARTANDAPGMNEHPSLAANALRSPANLPQTEKVPA
jgi:hypothetical protein